MKIILISASSESVGVSVHILNLALLLQHAGMLDIVICPDEGWLTERLQGEQLPFVVLDISYNPERFIISNVNLFKFVHTRSDANIVHVHGRFPLFVSLLSMILFRNLSFVATMHQFSNSNGSILEGHKTAIETFLLRRLSHICCVSEGLRNQVVNRLGESFSPRIHFIPNWIQPTKQCKQYSNSANEDAISIGKKARKASLGEPIKICAVGRLVKEKGFDLLIDAIAILSHQGHKVICHIFGSGPEERVLANLVLKHALGDVVELKGAHPNTHEILSDYDLLVIPSRTESFGLVALEAFDSNLPIVASDIPGLNETVINAKTGILFEAGNIEALANSIMRVSKSEELAETLIRNGQLRLQEHIPSARLVDKYRRFYGKSYGEN